MQFSLKKSKYKILFIILLLSIMVFLSWLTIKTLTATTEDSSWDGVVSTSFKSGTGTKENPYVISTAGELAYFRDLISGENAALYANKQYVITNSFNFGNYDMTINNKIPFTGTIDGQGNTISDITIENSLFVVLENANIKNLALTNITYNKTQDTGAILAQETNSLDLDLVYIGLKEKSEATNYTGISYTDNSSNISNTIVDLKEGNDQVFALFNTATNTIVDNTYVNSGIKAINEEINVVAGISTFDSISSIDTESINNKSYEFTIENNNLLIQPRQAKSDTKRGAPITLHDSGVENNTLYVNDLDSDYDYYIGTNYSRQGNGKLPNGTSTDTYNDTNLVKVYIHYSGKDVNDDTVVGYMNSNIRISELYYYKYFPVENGSVKIELIDNPFADRPDNKAFNGWVTDYEGAVLSYDWEIYTRYVTVPVEDVSTPIEINMKATWTKASVITSTSSISSNINNTFKTGMVEYQNEVERIYGDVSNYYVVEEIDYGEYFNKPQGGVVYEPDGSRIWNDMCTDWWYGCEYLVPAPSGEYDPTKTYYNLVIPNNNYDDAVSTRVNVPYSERVINMLTDMENLAGNYQKVTVSRNGSINGLYDSNGKIQTGTCTSNSCTMYKLLQNTDEFENGSSYYYLATRDTNIFAPSGNLTSSFTVSKPMTITGLNNGTLYNRTLRSTLTVNSDLRIENISFTASSLSGRSNNVKIGMNVSTSSSCQVQGSYSNSSSNYRRYKTVVESGTYSNIFSTTYGSNYSSYGDSTTIVGNDYDRVRKVNNNLNVSTRVTPGQQSYVYGRDKNLTTDILNHIIIKSGSIGTTETSELTAGIYMGILGGGGINVATDLKVEGGYVVKIIGGVSRSTSWKDKNFAYINVTGGTVDSIIGGASYGTTQGNRIISITGGNITYSVFGGSNGAYLYSNSYTAALESSTFINVGGHAKIGTTTNNLVYSYGNTRYPNSTVEPGSIFGAGNGQTTNLNVGKVYNSVIVVNGDAEVNGNIYGGGNNGRIGLENGGTSSKIIVNSGTIKGSVYAGGNNNGAGSSSEQATTTVTINGGTVGNVYGGSRTSGVLYGNSSVTVNAGTINKNVYGGGEGNNTYVSKNVGVVIGSDITNPTIKGSVYGGSAYGTVNGASTNASAGGNTAITVNSGIINGSVFGGGEGNSTYRPYVLGNITVNINGGDITTVYGGNDQSGSHTKVNKINLNNGIVGTVYGGGNKSSVSNTNITLDGSEVTTIYGGSNVSGNVSTTTVTLTSGTVGTVYGGNNAGGVCTTSNVLTDGNATVTSSIYGGGNQVKTVTANIELNSVNGIVPNVYGGGKSSDVTTSTITNHRVSITNMFGGSNLSGIVNQSHIYNNGGVIDTMYGGNNAGGNTLISNINVSDGTVNTIYGGGNASGNNSSNIILSGGTIGNVYGGSNNSGRVDTTNLTISTEVGNVYGGGNLAEVNITNILVDNGTVGNVYGGGNLAKALGDTTITVKDSTINTNIYGGGNFGEVEGSSHVKITDSTILGSIYGGGNGETAILKGNTDVSLDGKTVVGTTTSVAPHFGSVFGGGNQAYTGTSEENNSLARVNIAGATIYGNVYGGANTSVIYGNTEVNIGKNTITDTTLKKDDIYIKGHVFGGGEANAEGSEIYDWYFISVTKGTEINVDAKDYTNFNILGSFYGGGNASSASGDSYLYINNYGASQQPKNNVSIQRVTNAVLNNSSVVLKGAIDRANDYDTELFAISRVDNLTLKNNSELYLVTGTNLLENFKSVTKDGTLAAVDIDEEGNVTKNVDNRVYVYEGKNVNIAHDQQVTEYGKVSGMTFFGLFSFNYDDSVYTGNYHPRYTTGDELSWSGAFTRGSYILGSHDTNHDITKNGFYSNFMDEDTLINEVKYIEPTPADAKFYMWFIGENVIEYNVNLTASKYSTLGSLELSFLEFTDPNTSFEILNFDSSELKDGISLVDKNDIPRIAPTEESANNTYGLSMEASNVGWLTKGKTSFYTANPNITGTTHYEGENSTNVPTMLFYLYHSKNITEEKELGTARISVMAVTKKSAISSEIKRLVINVNMSTALYQTVEYEGAMTPGDKYELFTSTSNNLTTKSKFSAYYALYGENTNLYKEGYHRVLTSTFVLPVNTKITMIDFANHQTNYYYHVIDDADVTRATNEIQLHNEVSYPLSLFTKMGSKENTDNYKDALMNSIYYDGTNSSEEFIFIVDLSSTNITEDKLNNKLLIEIRDKNEQSIITVLGIQHSQLTYNLYHDKDSVINTTITPSDNPLYIGYSDIFELDVDYHNESLNGNVVEDTQYFNSKLGVQIKVVSKTGKVMSGTDLVGTYFEMDGVKYYPDIYGTTHIKLSDKVGNTQKWLIFNTENSNLPTGSYDFIFETFGSLDGIYYGESTPDYKEVNINVINSEYGLNPVIDDESVVFDSNNEKELHYTINYESLLENPNIRLALYRRKYDTIYSGEYELVDLQNYLKQTLFTTNNEYEYLLISDPNPTNKLTLLMNDTLLSGTYRLAFRLYDGDVLIGTVIRYIVVKEGS